MTHDLSDKHVAFLVADKGTEHIELVEPVRGVLEAGGETTLVSMRAGKISTNNHDLEPGIVDGRRLTSYPSLATDIRNAGGNWVDEEVVVDNGLVTSRKPADLPAFVNKLLEEVGEGAHAGQRA